MDTPTSSSSRVKASISAAKYFAGLAADDETGNGSGNNSYVSPQEAGSIGNTVLSAANSNADLMGLLSSNRNSAVHHLRLDVQSFLDKIKKESILNPEKPLPDLLRFIRETGGSSSETNSLAENAFSSNSTFGLLPLDESNEFYTDKATLTPFVSHLTFRCVTEPETGEAAEFAPWDGDVALLFIDISGYSKVTTALASRGAHVLSDVVNSYLTRILNVVVRQFDGDVVKFAGDAVIATFFYEGDVRRACIVAARCALALQELCGRHEVDDADEDSGGVGSKGDQAAGAAEPLSLTLHIGVECGLVETDVFAPGQMRSMQRAYHFIGGEPLKTIGRIVDAARSGEVCVSQRVADLAGSVLTTAPTSEDGVLLLTAADDECDCDDVAPPPLPPRPRGMERHFIHPAVVRRLHHGIRASDMAEMRLLTLMFIGKQGATSVGDWFFEVQDVLDEHCCPIIQVIDDDKGVHIVAAVNLFVAEANPSELAVRAARAIADRELECATGIATGVVFCGVLGSELASRWDVTGPAAVRACRLMQYAAANEDGVRVIVDASVYDALEDISQLVPHRKDLEVKGSPAPIVVYTLSPSANDITSKMVTPQPFMNIYPHKVEELVSHITRVCSTRPLAIVSGPTGVGKRTLCERAAVASGRFVAFVHSCRRNAAPLAVGATIAQWFKYHHVEELRSLALDVERADAARHRTKMMHLCVQLIDATVRMGLWTMLIVTHAEFLDSLSLSFLQQAHMLWVRRGDDTASSRETSCTGMDGRWATVLTHMPLFGTNSVKKIMDTLLHATCAGGRARIPIIDVDRFYYSDMLAPGGLNNRPWRGSISVTFNSFAKAGGFISLANVITQYFGRQYFHRQANNLAPLSIGSDKGYSFVTEDGVNLLMSARWNEMSAEATSKLIACFDALPPRYQMLMKVLSAMSSQDPTLPFPISIVGQVTMTLVSRKDAKETKHDVAALAELMLVQVDGDHVSLRNPAMRDTLNNLLTPAQARSINEKCARIYSHAPHHREDAYHYLMVARFHHYGGNAAECEAALRKGWALLQRYREEHPDEVRNLRDEAQKEIEDLTQFEMSYYTPDELYAKAKEGFDDKVADLHQKKLSGKFTFAELETLYRRTVHRLHISGEKVFGEAVDAPPVLISRAVEKQVAVHHDFVRAKNVVPSIAVGPLLHYVTELGLRCVELAMATARNEEPDSTQVIAANERLADEYVHLVEQFERLIPPMAYSKKMKAAERERVLKFITRQATTEEALVVAQDYLVYVEKVITDREKRAASYGTFMSVLPPSVPTDSPLARAFDRLKGSSSAGHIDPTSFHNSMMALATCNWHPLGLTNKVSLRTIRVAYLRDPKGVADQLKSFLYLYCILKPLPPPPPQE